MRASWTRMALAAAIVAAGVIAPVASFAQAAEQSRVDLTLTDAPMRDAIQVLMKQTGISVVFEASDKETGLVSLQLKDMSAEDALKYICQAAGVFYRRDENGVYVITRTAPAVKPNESGISVPAPAAKRKLFRYRLQRADAIEVYKQLRGEYSFDPLANLREFNKLAAEQAAGRQPNMAFNNTTFGGMVPPSYTVSPTGQPTSITPEQPVSSSNNIELPGAGALQGGLGGQLGGGGGGLGGGGGGLGGGQGGGGLGGGGGAGGGQLSTGGPLLDPNKIDYISFDPNDNSIIIRTDEATWRELQGIVDQFDVAPKQVDVRVQFVTTTSSVSRSLGYDWLFSRGTMVVGNTPGSFARSSDPIFLSYATGNIQTRLRTFLQDGFGRVVASPSVRTLNNQAAFVQQGTITTIFLPQNFVSNGTQFTQYVPLQLPAISSLSVRPRINGDGTVTMTLAPSIQQFGQLRRSPDGQTIPDQSVQNLFVVARIRSGDTVAMAGFTSKSDLGSQSKFPILGDLPIIGQFFRSSIQDKSSSELLVFVTPVIIEDDSSIGQ